MSEETRPSRQFGNKGGGELDGVLARRRFIAEGQARNTSGAATVPAFSLHKPAETKRAASLASLSQQVEFSTTPRVQPRTQADFPFRGIVPLYEIENSKQLEQKVRAFTLSNTQLVMEVDKMTEKMNDADWDDQSERILAETENLIAATDQAALQNSLVMQARVETDTTSQAPHQHQPQLQTEKIVAEVQELRKVNVQLRGENEDLLEKNGVLSSETKAQHGLMRESQRMAEELERARAENLRLGTQLKQAHEEAEAARVEISGLREEHNRQRLTATAGTAAEVPLANRHVSSESKLRTALTERTTTTAELKEAIGAVDALVSESKRELAQRQLRERRAAFEALHVALDKGDEQMLVDALEASRRSEVDAEDIERGEAKLRELRELTQEQRDAKEKRAYESKMKKEVFLLVKKDDATGLGALLDGFDETLRWQDWKDYAGRSMWRCSQELRATRVQRLLAPILGMHLPEDRRTSGPRSGSFVSGENVAASGDVPSTTDGKRLSGSQPSPKILTLRSPTLSQALPKDGFELPDSVQQPVEGSGAAAGSAAAAAGAAPNTNVPPTTELRLLSTEEEAQVRAKCFRAVAQDDCPSLADLLDGVPLELWSAWQNKAGKDLVTLSEERGSSNAYTLLAKALGLIVEQKRDTFEESETVWVYLIGDVQPKRANVMEDTTEELDDILVQFWDGSEEPERVPRDSVRKMLSVN